jgi:hypothetical protein
MSVAIIRGKHYVRAVCGADLHHYPHQHVSLHTHQRPYRPPLDGFGGRPPSVRVPMVASQLASYGHSYHGTRRNPNTPAQHTTDDKLVKVGSHAEAAKGDLSFWVRLASRGRLTVESTRAAIAIPGRFVASQLASRHHTAQDCSTTLRRVPQLHRTSGVKRPRFHEFAGHGGPSTSTARSVECPPLSSPSPACEPARAPAPASPPFGQSVVVRPPNVARQLRPYKLASYHGIAYTSTGAQSSVPW